MALNLRRRTAGVPRWALVLGVLVALFLFFPIGWLPGGGNAKDLERVHRFGAERTCGAWLALPADARRAYVDGYAARLRERLPHSSVSAEDAERALAECARLDPSTDVFELLLPLVVAELPGG